MKSRPAIYVAVALFAIGITEAALITPPTIGTADIINDGSLANVVDGTVDVNSFVSIGPPGAGAFAGPYTINLGLGAAYDLTDFNLWNNAGVIAGDGEGIDAFTLQFLDETLAPLGSFSSNANDALLQQNFALSVSNVSFVNLIINSNHVPAGRRYAAFHEINFEGVASVPEPSSFALLSLAALGLFFGYKRQAAKKA